MTMKKAQTTDSQSSEPVTGVVLQHLVRQVFFVMVLHPADGWTRCGNAYGSRKAAREWAPFVSAAWRGLRTRVAACTIRYDAPGKMSERSRRVLDEKFNLNA